MEVTQEQLHKFNVAAQEFAKTHPDFPQKLAEAQARVKDGGVDLPLAAFHEIVRLCAPETAYTILTDEKEQIALHVAKGEHINDERVADRVRRIHSRLKRHDTFTTITHKPDPVETYLAQRREDRRNGKRR